MDCPFGLVDIPSNVDLGPALASMSVASNTSQGRKEIYFAKTKISYERNTSRLRYCSYQVPPVQSVSRNFVPILNISDDG